MATKAIRGRKASVATRGYGQGSGQEITPAIDIRRSAKAINQSETSQQLREEAAKLVSSITVLPPPGINRPSPRDYDPPSKPIGRPRKVADKTPKQNTRTLSGAAKAAQQAKAEKIAKMPARKMKVSRVGVREGNNHQPIAVGNSGQIVEQRSTKSYVSPNEGTGFETMEFLTPEAAKAAHKITEAHLQEVLYILRDGGSLNDAADIAGVSRNRLVELVNTNKLFRAAVRKAQSTGKVELLRRIKYGESNWQSAAWMLERKHRAEFSLNHTGEDQERRTIRVRTVVRGHLPPTGSTPEQGLLPDSTTARVVEGPGPASATSKPVQVIASNSSPEPTPVRSNQTSRIVAGPPTDVVNVSAYKGPTAGTTATEQIRTPRQSTD